MNQFFGTDIVASEKHSKKQKSRRGEVKRSCLTKRVFHEMDDSTIFTCFNMPTEKDSGNGLSEILFEEVSTLNFNEIILRH